MQKRIVVLFVLSCAAIVTGCNSLFKSPVSTDAYLNGINLSSGTLEPAFNKDQTNYNVKLPNSVTSITVSGSDPAQGATVSGAVELTKLVADEPRTATLTVTAEDGSTTKQYIVTVTRQSDKRTLVAALKTPENLTSGAATNVLRWDETTGTPNTVTTENRDITKGALSKESVTTTKVTASASYSELNILSPTTDVIYPGSVILQESIADGTYKEITSGVKRPVTLSYSLTGVPLVSKSLVPSLSTTRKFHTDVMSQAVPPQSSLNYQLQYLDVADESTFDLAIGAGASYTKGTIKASVKANFDYKTETKKNRILVKFTHTYYTVDIDQSGDNFLFDEFDISSFGGYRPTYVSTVAYGRFGYLSVETSLSTQDFKTKLDIACDATKASGDIEVTTAKKEISSSSSITVNLYGGSSTPTTLDEFMTEIREGGFSTNSTGTIVSYKLRFLDDNTIANTMFSGEYTVRKVQSYTSTIDVKILFAYLTCSASDGADKDLEMYGDILFYNGLPSSGNFLPIWSRTMSDTYDGCDSNSKRWIGVESKAHTFISENDILTIELHMREADGKIIQDCGDSSTQFRVSDLMKMADTFTLSTNGDDGSTTCEFQPKCTVNFNPVTK